MVLETLAVVLDIRVVVAHLVVIISLEDGILLVPEVVVVVVIPNNVVGSSGPQANLVIQDGPSSGVSLTSQTWFPDTGATNHVTPNVSAFSTLEEYI